MKPRFLHILAILFTSVQAYAQIYTYDANNKLTKVEYGNGVTVSYEYDVLGNRTSRKVTGSIAETYTIKVSAVPSNYGTVSGGGTFGIGTNVEISASPYAGFEFQEWNDGSTDNPRTFTVTKDQSFTAHFKMSETNNNYDANGDGVINSYDLDAIIDAYLEGAPATPATDLDGDGAVTIADASILIAQLNDTHTGTYNGHDYVDLGLPSGTLWATCNVGASSPEETGCFYAWGEVTGSCEGKDRYSWSTYKYDNGMLGDELTKYNFDPDIGYNGFTDNLGTLDPTDDAATVNWGGNWRMPTRRELSELYNKKYTQWTFTTLNGMKGFIVTSIVKGYTGNSIFLPAEGGLYHGKSIDLEGKLSYYWTSTLTSNYQFCAECYDVRAYDGKHGTNYRDRCEGMFIRPVISADGIPAEPNLRLFAYDYDLDGTRYALYRQSDKNDVRYNADNTPYYRTKFTLDVTKNGSTETYTIDDNIYFTEIGGAQIPCMAIDLISNKMFIFVNSSNGYSYSLDGYCFVSSLNNINFQKETVFTEANFGWWPYFTYDNGTLQLQHFSYAGYYAMTSTRSSNGIWTTDWGYDIYPDEFRALSEQAGKVLLIRGGSQDCPVAEAIDLGLPSGTLWASWNVGASAPEEYGGYYAWGETEEKDYYDESTYKYYNSETEECIHIGDDIAGTEYDVAHVKWGGSWRMPTRLQQDELRAYCSNEWTQQNGVNGIRVTGPNGNSIFLPAAGSRRIYYHSFEGERGIYWSSSLYSSNYGCYQYFNSNYWDYGSYVCCTGLSVRAVINAEKAQRDCPIAEAIDLGLPSGTKWASWNIGASKPEEYGGYYAWGETEETHYYDWSIYTHCDGSSSTCHHIGDDIAGTEYDVAHVKWGGSWRMPTNEQQDELRENCTREWTQQNGVNGIRVTGPNGNSIFLPAAGYRSDVYLRYEGSYGYFWSSSRNSIGSAESFACRLRFNSSYWSWSSDDTRCYGYSVRAVCP